MYYLVGTLHVLLIYIIVGLFLCLPPLILPQWKRLVENLNKKEIMNKNRLIWLFTGTGIAITVVAMTLMCFHHPYIFELQFFSFESMYMFFNFYSFFSFILLPLALALILGASYMRYTSSPKLGNFLLLFLGILALGLAGSFFHDILWCGTRTHGYTIQVDAGYDLDWWRNFLFVQSKDYQVFGFYMIVLTIILCIYSFIMFKKHDQFFEKARDKKEKNIISSLNVLFFVIVGVALYIMEYYRIFTLIPAVISIFGGFPVSILVAWYLGKKIASGEENN